MLVALITNHLKNGFFIFRPGEGYEYVLTLLVVALCLGPLGAGDDAVVEGLTPGGVGEFGLRLNKIVRLAPCAGSGVVGLVDHDEIGLRGDAVKAPRERLHRCDLYGCICCRDAGSDDAVRHIGQGELGAGLRDQLTAMDQHDGAPAAAGYASKYLG
jgi:hypothetical protein